MAAILKPYVDVLAVPVIIPGAIERFAHAHHMDEFTKDSTAPLNRLITASVNTNTLSNADQIAEFAGRICYRAWGKGRTSDEYLNHVISERHGNVFAHVNFTFIITGISRACSMELIRHHVGINPSQESQRYVKVDEDGASSDITLYKGTNCVIPPIIVENCVDAHGNLTGEGSQIIDQYLEQFKNSLSAYAFWKNWLTSKLSELVERDTMYHKRIAEASRSVLQNSTETRLVWTANVRALFNFFDRRANAHADLEIRRLAIAIFEAVQCHAPLTFTVENGFRVITDVDHRKSIRMTTVGI